jgi:hypothetical protein
VQSQIAKNIYQTILYYDILNFPLTSFEIWQYLIAEEGCGLSEVVDALEGKDLENKIEKYRGFYFLPGRKDLAARRIQNDKNSSVKFEIAERVTRWLRIIPFVRMVAVTGTLAMKNCEKDSDIDFFVVLEKGRIFTARLLLTGMVHILRKRRYNQKIKNRICLNYFVAADKLEIERQDLFASNEYSFVYPIFGWAFFQKFCESNADWIKKFKPNWKIPELEPARYFLDDGRQNTGFQKFFENLINLFWGDRIEAWLKDLQIKRIERKSRMLKPGAYIQATDQNMIFLPDPQGGRIEKEWQRRIES